MLTVSRLRRWGAFALVIFGLGSAACRDRPRTRIGGLPFPGPFTMFKAADPQRLGQHRYGDARATGPREATRGMIYSCRAGFLDLAHLRYTVDWTRFARDEIRRGLEEGADSVSIQGMDRTMYDISFRDPRPWSTMPPKLRTRTLDEISLRLGQRVALLISTWHEVLTYSGYKTTGLVSEKRSAFTYDDMMSHVVGLHVAEDALRARQLPFDAAVTASLETRVEALGVVEPACMHEAIEAVRERWWTGRFALVFQVETGLESGQLDPIVVPELRCCPEEVVPPIPLPSLHVAGDFELSEVAEIRIRSRVGERLGLGQRVDPPIDGSVFTEAEVQSLVHVIREEMETASVNGRDRPRRDR